MLVGLYVRLTIDETPVFREAVSRHERVQVPMLAVLRDHPRTFVVGTLISLADLRALLPDDRVRALLGHQPAGLPRASSSC